MKKKKLIILVFLMIVVYSCENLNEPVGVEYPLSISSILEVNRIRQEIQLYSSLNYEDKPDYYDYGQYFIKGAEINLIENNSVYSDFGLYEKKESYHGNSFFYGNNSELEILPGKKYELKVTLNGIDMRGVTTVPGDFEIIIPSGIRNEDIVGMEVTWTKSDSAFVYSYFWDLAYQATWSSIPYEGFPPSDSTYYKNFDEVPPVSGHLTFDEKAIREKFSLSVLEIDSVLISVTAYDKNAYNHFIKKHHSAGVTNAYGVFGSSVTKTAVIVIEK